MIGILLSILTGIYILVSACQDLKERTIFSFPCAVLVVAWSIYELSSGKYEWKLLLLYWGIHLLIWMAFNYSQIWGGGDSDIYLLFSQICLVCIGWKGAYSNIFWECMLFAVSLCISLFISVVEAKVKKAELNLKSGAAVVPGFSVVMVLLLGSNVWKGMML